MHLRSQHASASRDLVLVLQPYVPTYRVAFFEKLDQKLRGVGLRLQVLAGEAAGPQAVRGDQEQARPWLRRVAVRRPLPWTSRVHSRAIPPDLRRRARVVVAELTLTSVDAWRLGLVRRSEWSLLYWGHADDYVTKGSWLTRNARAVLMRLGDGVLAYTEGGRQRALAAGLPNSRIFVVQNSTDVPAFEWQTRTGRRKAQFAFIGALDGSKRLEMLLEVADEVAQRRSDFVLVVAGDGVQRPFLQAAAKSRSYLKLVGRIGAREKLKLASESIAFLMPGRVGLVTIDSFNLGLPILTTRWRLHAPEYEYLRNGYNSIIVDDDVESMADAVISLIEDDVLLKRLVDGCRESAEIYTLDAMVDNFFGALLRVGDLSSGASRR